MKELNTLAKLRAARNATKAREDELAEGLAQNKPYMEYSTVVLERRAIDKEIQQVETEVRRKCRKYHLAGTDLPAGVGTRTYPVLRVLNRVDLIRWLLEVNAEAVVLNTDLVLDILKVLPRPELAEVDTDVKFTLSSKIVELYGESPAD